MKTIWFFLMIIATVSCAQKSHEFSSNKTDTEKIDSVFMYNFEFLDSFIKNGRTDFGYETTRAMRFMEDKTGVKSSGSMTYIGKLTFTKENLEAWHKWYAENKDKLVWDTKNKSVWRRKN